MTYPETEVACTSCGAAVGEVCRTKDGRPNRNPHNARIKAWIKRQQEATA